MIGEFVRAMAGRNERPKTAEALPQRGEISGNDSGFLGRWMPTRWNPDELITRRGMRWYDKIRRDDAVKGAMALKKGAVLSPGWELTPASEDPGGEEVVEFIQYVFEHMEPLYGNLDDHLQQILTALDYGFSITEIIWQTIEEAPYAGWWGLRTLKPRKPHRFWFDVDAHDNLLPNGICQDENKYPIEKFLHWGYRREFGNWYGQSDLRETYEWWWLKDNLIKWSAIYAERFAIPIATGTYPAGWPKNEDIVAFRTMLANIQANTSMTMSDAFTVKLQEAVGRGADVLEKLIKAADTGIARAILMPSQLGVTAQPDVGTYAQARKHFDVLLIVVQDIQNDVARQVVQQQLIRRLVHANYGPRPLPIFEFKPLQEEDEQRLFNIWIQAVTAGVVDTTPQDEIHIREMTDFPERTEKEIQAERDRLEAMLPQLPGPGGPEEDEEDEEDDDEGGKGEGAAGAAAAEKNGKPKAVAKATLAPPAHGRFVRRVRSMLYFDPSQPRADDGKWSETGAAGAGAAGTKEKEPEPGDVGPSAAREPKGPSERISSPVIKEKLIGREVKSEKVLGGGVSESTIVNLKGGTKAVFKPQDGEAPGIRSQIPDGTHYLRERAAAAVAEIGGLDDLVPSTVIRSIGGRIGSVQLFVKGAKPAAVYLPLGGKGRQPDKAFDGDRDLARAAVFDWLTGNTDRHAGNWLVRKNGKLALIDHGLTFPTSYSGFRNDRLEAEASNRFMPPMGGMEREWKNAPAVVQARKAWKGKWPQIEKAMKQVDLEKSAIKAARERYEEIVKGL
jgi:phage gp29-like protein